MTTAIAQDTVVLRPRPLARSAGILILVPLLPKPAPLKPLPGEIWSRILAIVIDDPRSSSIHRGVKPKHSKWDLVLVCRQFKNVALPLLYRHCRPLDLRSLEQFTLHLYFSEQRWDSIRRIPYSTPGRWVQSLDLSRIVSESCSELFLLDSLLTTVFPLTPFLTRLELNPSIPLSRRAMNVLGHRDGAQNLCLLKGVKYDITPPIPYHRPQHGEDPLTQLVSCCGGLEELEVLGSGINEFDGLVTSHFPQIPPLQALNLPHLHTLTMLSMPLSDLLLHLIYTPLPSLTNVVITPYGDLQYPASVVSLFLRTHGPSVTALILHTPKSWPTAVYPAPSSLLLMMPNLKILSIEHLLPNLFIPLRRTNASSSNSDEELQVHSLETLWVPRPTVQFRGTLEQMLPHLPKLNEVRARDVRWMKQGMSARALEAGFQGEMRTWHRILKPRRIKMLDADGRGANE
ncbi:hypothetical protein BD410DRAFT_712654 [Rickenella mellea]|uniref:F-box domain-containing protein n=1 Tax=Rickenella mellea TaxID=50990 RepID=A0A4Y7QK48_9AGAM|nr:hypothetical protein BD410DRAFT_712654 [Rickenella mellea]